MPLNKNSNSSKTIWSKAPFSAAINRAILYTGALLFTLSFLAICLNVTFYHYHGNNYFPPQYLSIALSLLLMYLGFFIQAGESHYFTRLSKEVVLFFIIMSLLAFASNAVQYTPFAPVDSYLIQIDSLLHIQLPTILQWTHAHQRLQQILVYSYDSLPYQMAFIPLLLMVTKHHAQLREYYYLLLITALFGFGFYYFFPTTGPASIIDSPYFGELQKATGLKFMQIHGHKKPSTLEGGLIALPSFHVIWAWLSLYLVRVWPLLWCLLLPFNLTLIASCVLLGWHYGIDLVCAFIVIFTAQGSLHYLLMNEIHYYGGYCCGTRSHGL